jgi:osmoprotectant transport system ATP-binding protein
LGWATEKTRQRVAEVLDLVGLPETQYGRRLPAELSGGQRQRVGVARGLAADPDLLLMDEPFGALDPGTRNALQDEFLRLQSQLHKTVVFVTHDLAEAGKLADDIVLLDQGQVIQQGSLRDLLLHPASERVKSFLGRQGQGLVLETLCLRHILDELPTRPATNEARTLSPELRLGEVLAALGDVADDAAIRIHGTDRALAVRALRDHLLADLRQAAW